MTYGRTINSTLYSALTTTGMPTAQLTYNITPSSACATQFPKVYADATSVAACPSNKPSILYFAKDFQSPMVYHVNLSLDRQLTSTTALQLSYLGSFGRDLPLFVDTNISDKPGDVTTATYAVCGVNGNGSTDLKSCYTPGAGQPIQTGTYTAPFYTARLHNGLATDPRATTDPLWNQFGAMTEVRNAGTSNYNALVVQVNRRMAKHFMYNANFTWSHAIDFGQNNTNPSTANGVLDPYNLDQEKGNSNQNVPRRFVFSAVAESPWKVSGWLGNFVNDWQIAPLWQWQNGLPYSVKTSGTPSGVFSGGGAINGANGDYRIYGGRNYYQQPNTQVWDLKLSKSVKFRERYSAEFSSEVFNVFNHQNVTSINSTAYYIGTAATTTVTTSGQTITAGTKTLTYNTGAYGLPTNANSNYAYSPRQVQLGVKVKF